VNVVQKSGPPTDVDQWSRRDMRNHLSRLYRDEFGVGLDCGIAYASNVITEVTKALKQRGIGCGTQCVKEYFDYFFATHVKDIVRKEKTFVLVMAQRDRYLDTYIKQRAAKEAPVPKASRSQVAETMSKLGLRGALLLFGPVRIVEEMVESGKPVADAVSQVTRNAVAAVRADKRYWVNITEATAANGPYVASLPWTDVAGFRQAVEEQSGVKLKEVSLKRP
jgi:hypothetical protein